MRRAALPLGLCLLCGLGGAARASLPDIAGMGTRSPALAGTGTAFLSGFDATYVNPAGLLGTTRRLTLGIVYGGYRLTLDDSPYLIDTSGGLLIGATLPLPLGGVMRDRLALGMGFYLPFGVINRAKAPFPDVPRAALLDARTQVVSVLLGAGARIGWGLSAGLGVLVLAALVGETRIAPDGSGRITAASQSQLTLDYAPIAGLRWQSPRGLLQLGALFRGVSKSTFSNKVTSQLGDTVPVELPTITVTGTGQYDPLQVAVEAAVRPAASLLLIANLTYKRWSAFEQPILPATEGAEPLPSPGYHDTVVPRLALEWRPPGGESTLLRLGYFFEWTPAPADEAARALLDQSRHVLTCGVGYRLPGRLPLQLDTYFQWHQLQGGGRLSGGFAMGGVSVGVDL